MKCVGFHAIYVMDDVEMNENGEIDEGMFLGQLNSSQCNLLGR